MSKIRCDNCGELIEEHTVCPHCGYYNSGKPTRNQYIDKLLDEDEQEIEQSSIDKFDYQECCGVLNLLMPAIELCDKATFLTKTNVTMDRKILSDARREVLKAEKALNSLSGRGETINCFHIGIDIIQRLITELSSTSFSDVADPFAVIVYQNLLASIRNSFLMLAQKIEGEKASYGVIVLRNEEHNIHNPLMLEFVQLTDYEHGIEKRYGKVKPEGGFIVLQALNLECKFTMSEFGGSDQLFELNNLNRGFNEYIVKKDSNNKLSLQKVEHTKI